MKRFFILFILILFVTVSCAGQKKWTKPDFRQDQFEKDREDCIQAVEEDPEQKISVEECLTKRGYESDSKTTSEKEKSKTLKAAKTVGEVLLITTLAVVVSATAVAVIVLSIL